ncbi:hypothetical protein Slin14017_G113100 [Septoria linicola]|nr:hypothetical protein Slin14017_G113100 [Septoria linicola]
MAFPHAHSQGLPEDSEEPGLSFDVEACFNEFLGSCQNGSLSPPSLPELFGATSFYEVALPAENNYGTLSEQLVRAAIPLGRSPYNDTITMGTFQKSRSSNDPRPLVLRGVFSPSDATYPIVSHAAPTHAAAEERYAHHSTSILDGNPETPALIPDNSPSFWDHPPQLTSKSTQRTESCRHADSIPTCLEIPESEKDSSSRSGKRTQSDLVELEDSDSFGVLYNAESLRERPRTRRDSARSVTAAGTVLDRLVHVAYGKDVRDQSLKTHDLITENAMDTREVARTPFWTLVKALILFRRIYTRMKHAATSNDVNQDPSVICVPASPSDSESRYTTVEDFLSFLEGGQFDCKEDIERCLRKQDRHTKGDADSCSKSGLPCPYYIGPESAKFKSDYKRHEYFSILL